MHNRQIWSTRLQIMPIIWHGLTSRSKISVSRLISPRVQSICGVKNRKIRMVWTRMECRIISLIRIPTGRIICSDMAWLTIITYPLTVVRTRFAYWCLPVIWIIPVWWKIQVSKNIRCVLTLRLRLRNGWLSEPVLLHRKKTKRPETSTMLTIIYGKPLPVFILNGTGLTVILKRPKSLRRPTLSVHFLMHRMDINKKQTSIRRYILL